MHRVIVLSNLANILVYMVRESWMLSPHCSKIPTYFSPSLVKWDIPCCLLIGSNRWLLQIVLHERFINDVRQRVRPWFHHPEWSAKGWFNIILVYPLWWYHALCLIWESLGPLDSRPSLCNDILHHSKHGYWLRPLQFGTSDLLWDAVLKWH